MSAALRDVEQMGVEPPLVYQKLASIGSGGLHKGNMQKDIAMVDYKLPSPMQVHMPFAGKDPGSWHHLQQQVFLPHELFAFMWHEQRKGFEELIAGPHGHVQAFWRAMVGNPQLQCHPIRNEVGFQDNVIPISLHGDGAPITGVGKSWSKSCDVFSWNSLLGGGRTVGAKCLGGGTLMFSIQHFGIPSVFQCLQA